MRRGVIKQNPGKGRIALTITAAAIILAVIGIAADSFALPQHFQSLRVGFNDFSPYISVTGEGGPAGLAVDVIKEAARRSGQSLTWLMADDPEAALRQGK